MVAMIFLMGIKYDCNEREYRAGLNMVVMVFMTGTKYACNESNEWDLQCLQSWSKRTKYAYNLFQWGPIMLAIIENLFSRDSFRNHSHVISGPFSTLQAYLVPIE